MVARRKAWGVVLALSLSAAVACVPAGATASGKATGPFFVSPAGSDSNPGTKARPWKTVQHAADRLLPGQTVFLRAGTYRERVLPARSGTAGRYITYAAYPGEAPVIDGATVTLPDDLAGLFEIAGRGYIRVSGLRIVNARPNKDNAGIMVIRSHDVVVERNRTSNTTSSGVGVWGSRNVVVSANDITRACSGGYQESLTVAGTDGFDVVGNVVHDTAKEGICLKDGSRNGKARGNTVHHVRAVGIYTDAWDKATSGIEISANTVHDTGSDGIALASEMGGRLSSVRVVNNVVYDAAFVGIAVTTNGDSEHHPIAGAQILNNTAWSNGGSWGGGIAVANPDATGVVVRNNIVSDNRSFQLVLGGDVPAANAVFDHNLVDGYRGDAEDGEIYGAAHVEGDPLFVNAPGRNFRLRKGSPAIDRGSAAGAPKTDFEGRARPRGAGYDIGAFEY